MIKIWENVKTQDVGAEPTASMLAILPLAALEQHGPHLPLNVDRVLVDGVLACALEKCQIDAWLLPTQTLGYSPEHSNWSGTISLSATTTIALWTEIIEAAVKSGAKKVLLFNAHGGNVALMDVVARDVRARLNVLVFSCSWFNLIDRAHWEKLIGAHEHRYGAHAGLAETAMMLALRPELVDMSKAQNFKSLAEARDAQFDMLGGGVSKQAWNIEDYHPSGAVGNAAAATAELGEAILIAAAQGLQRLLVQLDAHPAL